MVNLSASSPPIVQVTPPPTLESPVKVGVGLVNAFFSATLATAMRLILKLALDWKLIIALISPSLSFFVRSFSVAILRFFSERFFPVNSAVQ
jgi:hypothetical protein